MSSKLLFFLFSSIGVFLYSLPAYALDVSYPNLPFFGTLTQNVNSSQLFQFLFGLALWVAAIILFGSILVVGFQYMTSGGDPGKQEEARRRFGGIVMGAAMLFGVFIILNTVNPELVSLRTLTLGVCGGPNLPACPQIIAPTITGTTGTGTTGGTTGGTILPPPVPMPSPGNPAPGTDYGSQLYNALNDACGHFVNSSDVGAGCLDRLPDTIPGDVIATIKSSALAYNVLQCVGFVQAATQWLGHPIGHVPGDGAAKNLIDKAPYGYSYIAKGKGTVQAGDIALYTYDGAGHMAYVTEALPDTFKVVQANAGSKPDGSPINDGNLSFQQDNINNPGLAGWLRQNP